MWKILALAPLFLGLTACPPSKPVMSASGIPVRDPRTVNEKNDLIDFHFGWSAEAAAIDRLNNRFGGEAYQARAELRAMAEDGAAFAAEDGREFSGYFQSTDVETAGTSRELLSLRQSTGLYTGGAHPNSFTKAILWDRMANNAIEVSALFIGDAFAAMLRDRFCPALDQERLERRGSVLDDSIFNNCPGAEELSVIPVDTDENLRFEALAIIADPYIAGPYAEGRYEIVIAVDDSLLAGIDPAYRTSFEGQ